MAEQTRIKNLLKLNIETCNTALLSINDDNHNKSNLQPSLAVIHKDFISLLSLIYSSTTKLALVLNPSSPTYTAAVLPLNDLSKHISALSHCAKLFSSTEHGATVTQEAADLAKTVVEAVKALLWTFLEPERPANEYLVKTGTIHDIIEVARSFNGLSKDNVSAVRKRWIEDSEPLEDGARELKESIENSGDVSEDDGWEELGLKPDVPFSDQEADRAMKIHLILRLTALLHKKIYSHLLEKFPTNSVLDKLPSLSKTLVSAADEVIVGSHPPQDLSSLRLELNAYEGVLKDIKDIVSEMIGGLSLVDGEQGKKKISEMKWFNGCFEQIEKAFRTAEATLSEPEA